MPDKPKKTKAVIYCRVSDSRTAAESESCDVQERLCRAWCESQKLRVLAVKRDHAISGKCIDNRPGLQEAIHIACKMKAVLVCYSLSRLSRTIRECLAAVDEINKKHADFACVKENFDTSSASGELIFHIFAALQQFERAQIAERTSAAMLSHQANGRRMSLYAPYGMMIDPANPKRLLDNPTEMRIMRRIVSWTVQGLTLRDIANRLNEAGEKYAPRADQGSGNPWDFNKVFYVLKRAAKAGLYKKPEKPEKVES